jgi:hypothetical protein
VGPHDGAFMIFLLSWGEPMLAPARR